MQGPAESICLDCGLCCDGSLFLALTLKPEEADHADSTDRRGRPCLTQPCRWFDGHCTIYADRFIGCRSFECDLLRRYHASDVTAEQARATIAETRQMMESFSRRMEVVATAAARKRLMADMPQRIHAADPDERARLIRLALDLAAFDRTLRQRFVPRKRPAERDQAGPPAPDA